MHFREDDNQSKNVTPDPKIGQTFVWPFLIQNAMENPSCPSTPPDTIPALLWTTIAVFGIVYLLLGYRCLRAIGFLSGMAVGSSFVIWLQKQQITLLGSIPFDSALAVVAGLLGAVLGSAHPIASALVCAFAGALISGTILAACAATMPLYVFGEREIVVAVGGGAIICAVMTLCCAKFITVISSSIVGSAMIICSIDFFMHRLDTVNWILKMEANPSPPPCWGGILLCAWPVASMIGILVQFFITAWRINHQRPPRRRRQCDRRTRANSRPRETREEARQRKYRYLYQVRTAHGDIISQNYVSALQKRIQPDINRTELRTEPTSEQSTQTRSNERNTLQSDRTHFTNLPDSDYDKCQIATPRFCCDKRLYHEAIGQQPIVKIGAVPKEVNHDFCAQKSSNPQSNALFSTKQCRCEKLIRRGVIKNEPIVVKKCDAVFDELNEGCRAQSDFSCHKRFEHPSNAPVSATNYFGLLAY